MQLVVFLAGPDADMITGTGIPIDGGGTYLRYGSGPLGWRLDQILGLVKNTTTTTAVIRLGLPTSSQRSSAGGFLGRCPD